MSSQERDKNIKAKIEQTEKGERLQWLDSLNRTVLDKTEFKYDAIARVVIDYAIELDL
jgi:predicted P-loop ATPase